MFLNISPGFKWSPTRERGFNLFLICGTDYATIYSTLTLLKYGTPFAKALYFNLLG